MNKSIIAAILIILIALSSGCVEEISTDAYRCDTGSMLYLRSDYVYHVASAGESVGFHGNYNKTDDGKLFLDLGKTGISFVLLENGTNYIDADGDNWVLLRKVS